MAMALGGSPQVRRRSTHVTLAKGVRWGLIGGVAGTVAMDAALMGGLSIAGLPALGCYSVVGDTVARFFSILGLQVAGGIALGAAAHYVIGPVVGAMFGAIVARVDALRVDTRKKMIVLAVLYIEILSQPLLAMTPILASAANAAMSTPAILQWYGLSTVMHALLGVVLGLAMSYGLRLGK
jgi:hypothetical protein